MKKFGLYVRVSTNDKGQDLETQLIPLKEYVNKNGWSIYKIYSDCASGGKENRQGLDDMLQDAQSKLFDGVLVYRFDRLSRSTKQLITTLELFRKLGIDFVSINEQIDTSTSTGQLMFTIISAFAQFERQIISERVKSGLYKAKSQGKVLGKPKIDCDSDWILNLRKQGLSIRKIASKTGYGRGLVCRVLSSKPIE